MYYHLRGRLVEKNPTYVVIECGGVGYLVNISLTTFSQIGHQEECKLFTSFIVREDAQTLYGFASLKEKEVFEHLISVSGVGANTARLILSSLTENEVVNAILSDNVSLLQSVKGIGAKSAQRIIIDLKGKMAKVGLMEEVAMNVGSVEARDEAIQALEVLGFNKNVVSKTINKVLATDPDMDVEDLIKQALNHL